MNRLNACSALLLGLALFSSPAAAQCFNSQVRPWPTDISVLSSPAGAGFDTTISLGPTRRWMLDAVSVTSTGGATMVRLDVIDAEFFSPPPPPRTFPVPLGVLSPGAHEASITVRFSPNGFITCPPFSVPFVLGQDARGVPGLGLGGSLALIALLAISVGWRLRR
jgi:hypothetical protein